jgi:SNF2 family DNA or RNA helicase
VPFLENACPKCTRPAVIKGTYNVPNTKAPLHELECSHFVYDDDLLGGKSPENFRSLDHKTLMKFQIEGVKFFNDARREVVNDDGQVHVEHRAILTDEMGLGKTVQALGWLALNDYKTTGRVLFIVKSSLKVQWLREIIRWVDEDWFVQTIEASSDHFLKANGYIIPYDLVRRIKDLPEKLKELNVKTMILDECQQIKNEDAGRSVAIRILGRQMDNVLALSGTPIKNNAGEYWAVLNLVRPDLFPNASHFRMNECQAFWTGHGWKAGGLFDADRFKSKTSPFILRRTREEVMPDLPKVFRKFQFDELGKEVQDEYIRVFVKFRDDYNETGGGKSDNRLALLSRMRHLTGLSKVRPCVAFVEEFLEERPGCPLTIFFHHKDVGELLEMRINKLLAKQAEADGTPVKKCLMLTSDLDAMARQQVVDDFRNGVSAIALLSTLASAEGLNLQFCDEFVFLERQWNPANEEQAEGRFPRIGSTASSISGTYLVAIGTVDEFFAEIVEQKRAIVANTLDNKDVEWSEATIMQELAERLAAKGGTRWRL